MFEKAISGYSLQAVVDVAAGRTIYHEMLVRFSGGLNVQQTILEAESAKSVHLIDLAVLRAAAQLIEDEAAPGPIATNLSPITIERHGGEVLAILSKLGPLANQVVLEITETAPIMVPSVFQQFYRLAAGLGVRFAIDDLGNGFCDAARLTFLDADFIKVPKAGPYGWAKMHPVELDAVLAIARELEAVVIAEGIETASDVQSITELGIEGAQGYYYEQPQLVVLGTTHRRTAQGHLTHALAANG